MSKDQKRNVSIHDIEQTQHWRNLHGHDQVKTANTRTFRDVKDQQSIHNNQSHEGRQLEIAQIRDSNGSVDAKYCRIETTN